MDNINEVDCGVICKANEALNKINEPYIPYPAIHINQILG